jgi:hypothetical protein
MDWRRGKSKKSDKAKKRLRGQQMTYGNARGE